MGLMTNIQPVPSTFYPTHIDKRLYLLKINKTNSLPFIHLRHCIILFLIMIYRESSKGSHPFWAADPIRDDVL